MRRRLVNKTGKLNILKNIIFCEYLCGQFPKCVEIWDLILASIYRKCLPIRSNFSAFSDNSSHRRLLSILSYSDDSIALLIAL